MKKFILLFCVFLGNPLLSSAHAGTVSLNHRDYRIVDITDTTGAHPTMRCPGPYDADGCWGSGAVVLELSHRQQNVSLVIRTKTVHGINAAETERYIRRDVDSLMNTLNSIKTGGIERQEISGRDYCFRNSGMIIGTTQDVSSGQVILTNLDRDITLLRRRVSCR